MAKEIAQWRVFCIDDNRTEVVNLPFGAPAPTQCPIDPEHAVGDIGVATLFDARHDLSGQMDPPGLTEDINDGWAIGSVIQAKDGNLWQCEDSTAGAAYWRDLSGGFPALTLDYADSNQPNGWQSISAEYEALPRFRFPGRTKAGRPTKIIALCKCDDGVTGRVRIYDVGTVKTVAESATFNDNVWVEIDFGAITNIPNTSAIWEVHMKRTAGGGQNKVYVSFVTIEF